MSIPNFYQVSVSGEVLTHLEFLDQNLIGKDEYMGLAYFWNYEYRHPMRDISSAMRRRVHRKFLHAKLPINDASPAHKEIIDAVIKNVRI
jgi:hypothetical protein